MGRKIAVSGPKDDGSWSIDLLHSKGIECMERIKFNGKIPTDCWVEFVGNITTGLAGRCFKIIEFDAISGYSMDLDGWNDSSIPDPVRGDRFYIIEEKTTGSYRHSAPREIPRFCQTPLCGSQLQLLFTQYVCNHCQPPGRESTPPVRPPFYYRFWSSYAGTPKILDQDSDASVKLAHCVIGLELKDPNKKISVVMNKTWENKGSSYTMDAYDWRIVTNAALYSSDHVKKMFGVDYVVCLMRSNLK